MTPGFVYPPSGALMQHHIAGDFLDSQTAELPDPDWQAVDVALRTVFVLPGWAMALLWLRNALVRPFGPKTGAGELSNPPTRENLLDGSYGGVFAVESVEPDEIVLGSDDRHLDFRISVLKTQTPQNHVALSTWVHPHNLWGRLYLWAVYPFHRLIVGRMLANLEIGAGLGHRRVL